MQALRPPPLRWRVRSEPGPSAACGRNAADGADAPVWTDPEKPANQAGHLLRAGALGAACLAWHQVDRALGNVRNDGPQVAAPIAHAA